jgi:hypothetical protein
LQERFFKLFPSAGKYISDFGFSSVRNTNNPAANTAYMEVINMLQCTLDLAKDALDYYCTDDTENPGGDG